MTFCVLTLVVASYRVARKTGIRFADMLGDWFLLIKKAPRKVLLVIYALKNYFFFAGVFAAFAAS